MVSISIKVLGRYYFKEKIFMMYSNVIRVVQ